MTIEKRGVMYWINFAVLTLFTLASIAFVALVFNIRTDGLIPKDYSFKINLTFIILFAVAILSLITSLVFYVLKKTNIFAILMAVYYMALLSVFIHGFDRAHKYVFSNYSIILKLIVIFTIVSGALAIINSFTLSGLFNKTIMIIASIITIVLSIVSIAIFFIWAFIENASVSVEQTTFMDEFGYTATSCVMFAIPLFIISLWLFITSIKNGFIKTNKTSEETQRSQETINTETNIPNQKHYCANCGTLLEEGVAFCPECGKPSGESQPINTYDKQLNKKKKISKE